MLSLWGQAVLAQARKLPRWGEIQVEQTRHKTDTEKMKRTRRLTIETQQVQVIRRRTGDRALEAWCAACAAQVAWVTPDVAAQRMGQTTRALYGQVEAGALHFCETAEGGLLLCLGSLAPP